MLQVLQWFLMFIYGQINVLVFYTYILTFVHDIYTMHLFVHIILYILCIYYKYYIYYILYIIYNIIYIYIYIYIYINLKPQSSKCVYIKGK